MFMRQFDVLSCLPRVQASLRKQQIYISFACRTAVLSVWMASQINSPVHEHTEIRASSITCLECLMGSRSLTHLMHVRALNAINYQTSAPGPKLSDDAEHNQEIRFN
jgi:hypothetical protein